MRMVGENGLRSCNHTSVVWGGSVMEYSNARHDPLFFYSSDHARVARAQEINRPPSNSLGLRFEHGRLRRVLMEASAEMVRPPLHN